MTSLAAKIALVTGGGRGIGRGIALELAKADADVVVADLSTENASRVVSEIQALGRKAIALKLDVTNEQSIAECIDKALAHFGRIDILVNNAGVMQSVMDETVTTEDLDLCYEVNVKGVWSVSRALIPHLKKNGEGKIVNIASVSARRGHKSAIAYCASKAAVISLTQAFAGELGTSNINVNAVCPGAVWTPMWESMEKMLSGVSTPQQVESQKTYKAVVEASLLKRPITPEDIGRAVVFFASDAAKNITAQALNVCGGAVAN